MNFNPKTIYENTLKGLLFLLDHGCIDSDEYENSKKQVDGSYNMYCDGSTDLASFMDTCYSSLINNDEPAVLVEVSFKTSLSALLEKGEITENEYEYCEEEFFRAYEQYRNGSCNMFQLCDVCLSLIFYTNHKNPVLPKLDVQAKRYIFDLIREESVDFTKEDVENAFDPNYKFKYEIEYNLEFDPNSIVDVMQRIKVDPVFHWPLNCDDYYTAYFSDRVFDDLRLYIEADMAKYFSLFNTSLFGEAYWEYFGDTLGYMTSEIADVWLEQIPIDEWKTVFLEVAG